MPIAVMARVKEIQVIVFAVAALKAE